MVAYQGNHHTNLKCLPGCLPEDQNSGHAGQLAATVQVRTVYTVVPSAVMEAKKTLL